ncbi:twin-arginine translocation signal domain-containing protein [Marixanthotalea marina]|nr:twin-arginine translocation signal domain-containing protein [Marixanthotalea marina]
MKKVASTSRRQFLGAVALGATASTLSILTNPIYADIPIANSKKMEDADD